jgi:hypothetical protein
MTAVSSGPTGTIGSVGSTLESQVSYSGPVHTATASDGTNAGSSTTSTAGEASARMAAISGRARRLLMAVGIAPAFVAP